MTDTDAPAEPSVDDLVAEAVDLFKRFGFTEYEAKCYVALVRTRTGTAREIGELADVPRARVYDCVDELRERGLVEVQGSNPKQYRGVTPDTALDTVEAAFEDRLDRLSTVLPQLDTDPEEAAEGDVWVMEGLDTVGERLSTLIDDAEREVVLAVATESLLETDLPAALGRASDRGVDVTVGSPGAPVRERVADAAPDATVVETWTWWEEFPVRPGALTSVLLVDDDALFVSSDAGDGPAAGRHRAVWTDGEGAPLVPMMRPLLTNAVTRNLATG
jgi:sugar-specific transcriptional regulator TrmB